MSMWAYEAKTDQREYYGWAIIFAVVVVFNIDLYVNVTAAAAAIFQLLFLLIYLLLINTMPSHNWFCNSSHTLPKQKHSTIRIELKEETEHYVYTSHNIHREQEQKGISKTAWKLDEMNKELRTSKPIVINNNNHRRLNWVATKKQKKTTTTTTKWTIH